MPDTEFGALLLRLARAAIAHHLGLGPQPQRQRPGLDVARGERVPRSQCRRAAAHGPQTVRQAARGRYRKAPES